MGDLLPLVLLIAAGTAALAAIMADEWRQVSACLADRGETADAPAGGPIAVVSRDVARVFDLIGPPPGRFVGRARPLTREQVADLAEIDRLEALYALPAHTAQES